MYNIVKLVFVILVSAMMSINTYAKENHGLELVNITEHVKAIVGPISNRTPDNLGNNATFGVVVTKEGVVLIDSGGSEQGAKAIHSLIKTVTDQPIKYVINTGGQDHRWFGNHYFKALGAKIITSTKAKQDQAARLSFQWDRLESLIGKEAIKGTEAEYADITFDENYDFQLGETKFEIRHKGQAHTPGDAFVWLPSEKLMFAGDIVYLDRMLGIGEQSNSKTWMDAFEAMAAYEPKTVIPGHGKPASLANAKASTYDYLHFLREEVGKILEDDGDMEAVSKVDQSKYKVLYNYQSLSGRNIQKVFSEMEFE